MASMAAYAIVFRSAGSCGLKGSAKNCVANFALDRTTGASGSRQIDAVEIEKALLLPPLDRQGQVIKMAQVARFTCASIARCKDRRTLER
jgi:hypothetical protein